MARAGVTILLLLSAAAAEHQQQRESKFFYNFLGNSSTSGSSGKTSGVRDAQQDQGSLLSNFFQTLGMTFGLSGASLSWPRPHRKAANTSEPEETVKTGPVVWPTCSSKKRCLSHEFTGCGVPVRWGRVVNGSHASPLQHPWMVGVYVRAANGSARFQCGATVINERYVVTAAHCLEGYRARHLLLRFGDYHRLQPETGEAERALQSFVVHPRFRRDNFDNDIALLKLSAPIRMSTHIRPICLPTKAEDYSSRLALIIGWGRLSAKGAQPELLQQASVPVLHNDDCRSNFKYHGKEITDNMFCAGYFDGMHDACMGDSGGPILISDEHNQSVIVGITSWGDGCAKEGYPGVYTRIANYLHWILDNTKDTCFCH